MNPLDLPTKFYRALRGVDVYMDFAAGCNLRCRYCMFGDPANRDPRKKMRVMPLETFTELMRQMKPYTRNLALSCSFEPFTVGNFADYLAAARTLGPANIDVVSNATLLSDKIGAALVDAGVRRFMVSIDNPDPAKYAAIRIGADLEQVRANLLRLVAIRRAWKKRFPIVAVYAVLLRQNLTELREFVPFAAALGAEYVCLLTLVERDTLRAERVFANEKETVSALEKIRADALRLGVMVEGATLTAAGLTLPPSKRLRYRLRENGLVATAANALNHLCAFGRKKPYCHWPHEALFIDPDGAVYPCQSMRDRRMPIGNVNLRTFGEILRSNELRQLRQRIENPAEIPPVCAACEQKFVRDRG